MIRRPTLRSLTVVLTLALTPALLGAVASASSENLRATEAPAARAANQTASLRMHPQLAQPGPGTRNAAGARSSMSAVFRPVRKGRTVGLQRRVGDRWVTVDRGRQNGRGIAEFNAPYRRNGNIQTYRAYTARSQGLPWIKTDSQQTDRWGSADFTDQFRRSTLGADWSHRYQNFNTTSLRKCSEGGVPRAARVTNGVLRLSVLPDAGPNPRTRPRCKTPDGTFRWRANGHVSTSGAQSFRYGYAAARIRFQPRRGQHAAFWMQPQSRLADEGSARRTGAEIDVIEWFGGSHPSGGLATFVYDYPRDGKRGITPRKTGGYIKDPGRFGSAWATRFHVFSVEWTPSRYVFRIDGKETYRTSKGVSARPEFLILSLLSSDYELKYLGGEGRLPQHMYVDWVRFWER